MFKRGGMVDVKFGFGLGLASYNKVVFEKDGMTYEIVTWLFLFLKYEEIIYRYN